MPTKPEPSAHTATDAVVEAHDLEVHFALQGSALSRLLGRRGRTVKAIDGVDLSLRRGLTVHDLVRHERAVQATEAAQMRARLDAYGVTVFHGTGSFQRTFERRIDDPWHVMKLTEVDFCGREYFPVIHTDILPVTGEMQNL